MTTVWNVFHLPVHKSDSLKLPIISLVLTDFSSSELTFPLKHTQWAMLNNKG